jgi:hypothetical protein
MQLARIWRAEINLALCAVFYGSERSDTPYLYRKCRGVFMRFSHAAFVVLGCLAALPVFAAQVDQKPKEMDASTARQKIIDLNRMWGTARVAVDKATFEKTLAPDFYVEFDGQKQTRQQFIDEISQTNTQFKMIRFDVEVQTVMQNGDHWDAVIAEKLEGEGTGKDGKKHHLYSLWITRDGWKAGEDHWTALYSIAIGHENWHDQAPPVAHWDA